MAANEAEKLTRKTKLMYGAGDFGFSMNNSIIGILFAIFLTDVVGIAPALAAAAIFIGRSWDWINDPIIGHLSDRTRTKLGRRRPFLLIGFLPFALMFAALWWRPPFESQYMLAAYYGLMYLLYDAAATLVYMPYYSLTPELSSDYDERTSLTSYRMAFSIVGGLVAFTLPLMLIGPMRPENAERVALMGIIFGLIAAMPLLVTFFGTKERREYQEQAQPKFRDSIRAALRNRPFIFAAGLFLFTWATLEVVQMMLLYFIKYHLLMERSQDTIAGMIFVVALLTLPFWEKISRRLDKRIAYVWGMAFLAVVMLVITASSPSWGLFPILALAALAGIGVGAAHVLPWAIIPDAIEYDELTTGQRHEGVFYSLVALMRKVASSIALPLVLLVLDRSGYVSNAAVQPDSALMWIRILVGPIPALMLVIGIVFAIVYPISRAQHADMRAKLASRKAAV